MINAKNAKNAKEETWKDVRRCRPPRGRLQPVFLASFASLALAGASMINAKNAKNAKEETWKHVRGCRPPRGRLQPVFLASFASLALAGASMINAKNAKRRRRNTSVDVVRPEEGFNLCSWRPSRPWRWLVRA
jgi:hypothetical protein